MNITDLKNVDVRTVKIDDLVDIKTVKINTKLTKKERILDFIMQIKNPYCYRNDDTIVKVTFSNTKKTMDDCMIDYLGGM